MKLLKTTVSVLLTMVSLPVVAQQIEFLVTEFNQSKYQTGQNTAVGMGTLDGWNWPSFTFFAAIGSRGRVERLATRAVSPFQRNSRLFSLAGGKGIEQ